MTWLICMCLSASVRLCSPGEMDRQHDSIVGEASPGSLKLFRVDAFISFSSLPHLLALSHIFAFVSSLSSSASLPTTYQSGFVFSRYVLKLVCLLFSLTPPDNDRAKECQSHGRRLSPGQDASRT